MRVTIKPDALARPRTDLDIIAEEAARVGRENTERALAKLGIQSQKKDQLAIKPGDLSSDAARAEYLERVLRLVALISENGCSSLAVDIHRLTQGAITRVTLAKKGAPR